MKEDLSYLDEDRFLLELTELSSRQLHIHKFDIERLAELATDQIAVGHEQLLKRSYEVANALMEKEGYQLVPGGHYEVVE